MVLKESTLTKLTITDVPHLDPINVFFEDYGPQRGKVTIEVCGDSWSYFWEAMGEGYTIKSFVFKADTDYIVKKLSTGLRPTIDDDSQDALILAAKKYIIKDDEQETQGASQGIPASLGRGGCQEIFGCDWYDCLPQKPNLKYEYLCRIVNTIKEALRISPDCV
jgi:hypothetical protein